MGQFDITGLALSTRSPEAVEAMGDLMNAYLGYRLDMPVRLKRLLEADPDYGFAHTLHATFVLLAYKRADLETARQALARAAALSAGANERERAHWQATDAWARGDPLAATRCWETICVRWPTDILAFRLHHFVSFWMGRHEAMLSLASRQYSHWQPDWPFYGGLLACMAFANEEAGNFLVAENFGRRAVELDPGDPWGAHAVAHVIEMQQRHEEGILWLESLQQNWADRNNIRHHLAWHLGLYYFEQGDDAKVLELYDTGFRNLESPLTQAVPDLFIDIQNAVSMLVRLELKGIDVGSRWQEIAVHAKARIGDMSNPFSVPHYLIALCAAGDVANAKLMIEATEIAAEADGHARDAGDQLGVDQARTIREALLPVLHAILCRYDGEHDQACDLFRGSVGGLFRLGGSHAQQDLFGLLAADSAKRAGRDDLSALLSSRLAGRYGWEMAVRRGYQHA